MRIEKAAKKGLHVGAAAMMLGAGVIGAAQGQTAPKAQAAAKPGVLTVNYHGKGGVNLLSRDGKYQGQYLKNGRRYKYFESKTINGELMFRLGTNRQWIPSKYTNLANARIAAHHKGLGVIHVPVINNNANWKVALRDGNGNLTGNFITTNSNWVVIKTKIINNQTFYCLGTDNQWIPAEYTGKVSIHEEVHQSSQTVTESSQQGQSSQSNSSSSQSGNNQQNQSQSGSSQTGSDANTDSQQSGQQDSQKSNHRVASHFNGEEYTSAPDEGSEAADCLGVYSFAPAGNCNGNAVSDGPDNQKYVFVNDPHNLTTAERAQAARNFLIINSELKDNYHAQVSVTQSGKINVSFPDGSGFTLDDGYVVQPKVNVPNIQPKVETDEDGNRSITNTTQMYNAFLAANPQYRQAFLGFYQNDNSHYEISFDTTVPGTKSSNAYNHASVTYEYTF